MQHPIHSTGYVRVVGNNHKTGALLPIQLQHQFIDQLCGISIQISRRLIRKYAFWTVYQSPGNGSPLAFTS